MTDGFNFAAENTINGSGLNATTGEHSTVADEMWSSNGTFTTPNDTLPAFIEFDLGSNYDLASTHVWNWNHSTTTNRGANSVTISVAEAVGVTFNSIGDFTFAQATGTATYTGETHTLAGANNVRLVRFDITTNHGDGNDFAALSEVQFEGTAIPEPSAALLGGLGMLALLRRRR